MPSAVCARPRETLDLLAWTLRNQPLVDATGRAVLDLISGYVDTWRLLLEFDEDRLAVPDDVNLLAALAA